MADLVEKAHIFIMQALACNLFVYKGKPLLVCSCNLFLYMGIFFK
jgi:hypothetical protein